MPDHVIWEVPPFPSADVNCVSSQENCQDCEHGHYDETIVKSLDFELDMTGNVRPFCSHISVTSSKNDWTHTIEDSGPAKLIADAISTNNQRITEAGLERIVLTNCSLDASPDTDLSQGEFDLLILGPQMARVSRCQNTPEAAEEVINTFILQKDNASPGQEYFRTETLGFSAVVLICSHMRRDKRCGKTAPVLMEEFEVQLREV